MSTIGGCTIISPLTTRPLGITGVLIVFPHPCLSSVILWEMLKVSPIYSLMSFPHLFICLAFLCPPGTVLFELASARPDDLVMCPFHLSFLFLTAVSRCSKEPMSASMLVHTSSLVTMIFSTDVQDPAIVSHLKGLDSPLEICSQSPCFT